MVEKNSRYDFNRTSGHRGAFKYLVMNLHNIRAKVAELEYLSLGGKCPFECSVHFEHRQRLYRDLQRMSNEETLCA